MKLYHGTNCEFLEIDLLKSHKQKDFGQGFYLSDNREQANEMALHKVKQNGGDDFRFLVDCITTEWIALMMEKEHLDMQTAMGRTLSSRTYQLLCEPTTALSWQSSGYIYEFYKQVG